MKLTKETYIHNCLIFDESEKDILLSTVKIISAVRNSNIHSCGSEDTYLNEICNAIIKGIPELLDNYSNEYPDESE